MSVNTYIGNTKDGMFVSFYKVVIVLLLILGMGGIVSHFYGLIIDVLIVLLCVPLILFRRSPIKRLEAVFIVFIAFYFIISSFVTSTPISFYVGLYLRVICGVFVLLAFKHDFGEFRFYLNIGLWIICVLSLINFLLYNFFPFVFQPAEFSSGRTFYNFLYLFNYIIPASYEFIIRNPGSFMEPGVLQIYLNLLILDELIIKKKSFIKVWLPMLMIITTFSTAGFIFMLLIFIWKILFVDGRFKQLYKKIIALIFLAALAVPLVWSNFDSKFAGEGSGSSALRFYDLNMGINIIRDNPIFGIGMDLSRYYKYNTIVSMAIYSDADIDLERGNSNSLMAIGMHLGLLMLILYIIAIAKQRIFPCRLLFFLFYILAGCAEPLTFAVLNIVIALSSLSTPKKKTQIVVTC